VSVSEDGGVVAAVFDEFATAFPRLLTRTRRQLDVARNLATIVVCRRLPPAPTAPAPARQEHVQLTVVDVVAEDWPGGSGPHPTAAPPATTPTVPPPVDGPTPSAAELPLEDYDALAASQVVPRLGSLSVAELELVGRYERLHRNRQTILHRVGQLLDSGA